MIDQNTQHVLDEALKLPRTQRTELIDALLGSIPEEAKPAGSIDPEVGSAWGEEVSRRMAEAESGQVDMIPVDQALPGRRDG